MFLGGVSGRNFMPQNMFPGLWVHVLYVFFLNFILNSTFITFISEERPKFALVKKIHILFFVKINDKYNKNEFRLIL